MVAARAAVSPTMSPGQQKLMQYLPVVFAIFQIFFLLGLVIYYIVQSVLRILQQVYITKRFYGHDEALGRQAQRAGEQAREIAKQDGGGGGMLSQARRDLADTKSKGAAGKQSSNDKQSGGKAKADGAGPAAAGRYPTDDPAQEPTDANQPNHIFATERQSSQEPQEALTSLRSEQTWNGWRRRARRSPRPKRPPSIGSGLLTTTPSSRSSKNHATACSA